ncbi:MAG: hypothetical protein KGL03_13260 [Nitrospirota bacterium]|nr:hypothetical protein [Nitrospirota bacterium]
MPEQAIEKHQLAGVDERDRGFNRLVEIEPVDGTCRATLRYEATLIVTPLCQTEAAALDHLIGLLHDRGYRQLRSRLSFQGATYLGTQKDWIEYPDPEQPGILTILMQRLRGMLGFGQKDWS